MSGSAGPWIIRHRFMVFQPPARAVTPPGPRKVILRRKKTFRKPRDGVRPREVATNVLILR